MDAEWAAIEAKTSGKDVAFKAVSVSCLVGGALLGLSRSECSAERAVLPPSAAAA
jgi:hypothetical protein